MRPTEPTTHPRQAHPYRPGSQPRLSADARPGHPRNHVARDKPVRFTDWGLI
ncbi:hypothetical protein [Natronohydrobacter thiooxidans]|uniref:hypothetical protein n=1 Tax=Natronohydrobacter thiooxidans TaxID=87172 RepID=UPI000B26F763|nr:hypothetical protein [Natronohydrobacter thiooxidans]